MINKDFLLPNLANKQKVNMSVRSVSANMLTSLVKYPKKAKENAEKTWVPVFCSQNDGRHVGSVSAVCWPTHRWDWILYFYLYNSALVLVALSKLG